MARDSKSQCEVGTLTVIFVWENLFLTPWRMSVQVLLTGEHTNGYALVWTSVSKEKKNEEQTQNGQKGREMVSK